MNAKTIISIRTAYLVAVATFVTCFGLKAQSGDLKENENALITNSVIRFSDNLHEITMYAKDGKGSYLGKVVIQESNRAPKYCIQQDSICDGFVCAKLFCYNDKTKAYDNYPDELVIYRLNQDNVFVYLAYYKKKDNRLEELINTNHVIFDRELRELLKLPPE